MERRLRDVAGILRGWNKVLSASLDSQFDQLIWGWRLSSVRRSFLGSFSSCSNPPSPAEIRNCASSVVEKTKLVCEQNSIILRRLLSPRTTSSSPELMINYHDFVDSIHTSVMVPHTVNTPTESEKFSSSVAVFEDPEKSYHQQPARVDPFPLSSPPSTLANTSPRSFAARERRVPSSRIGRVAGFGNLVVGLGLGAAAEWTKRKVGFLGFPKNHSDEYTTLFLTDENLERIVDTLCRMRGAALKLGQMLSIQDDSIISPKIQKIFERVRQAADFMPSRQMYKVLAAELGPDWVCKVASFEEKPFAAASIGQVHRAFLHDGRSVAMKIQYPGVADSIDSDISNLMAILTRFNILPPGLFAGRAVAVAKRELQAECDYKREAYYCKRFATLLADDPVYQVPVVIDELSTTRVLTTEFMDGIVLDDCAKLPQNLRNWIGQQLLRLCLKEVFVLRVMQSDPNWSNFLYNPDTGKMVILDFGASRDYDKKFVDVYIQLIRAAAEGNRDDILKYSQKLGFLTGYETKVMTDAHVDAVSILGEAFSSREPFDFGRQSTTRRVNQLIPVMMKHRLTPPPDETYSLHRKLSGCFLLCGKLRAVVECRPLFYDVFRSYSFDSLDNEIASNTQDS